MSKMLQTVARQAVATTFGIRSTHAASRSLQVAKINTTSGIHLKQRPFQPSKGLVSLAALPFILLLLLPLATAQAETFCSEAGTCPAAKVDQIRAKNADNKVVVYSKSYCPYCARVKGLFGKLNVDYKLVELDEIADGGEIQAALSEVTGVRTVPQVFVGGTFIGGSDDTLRAHSTGKLQEVFEAAGVQAQF